MRGLATLFALGLMMALFHRLTAGGPLEARATLALGFLAVAAWLGGELARRMRVPRLTGYLLIGLAVGPAWAGLVRRDEVEALGFIGDAAVALIALAAGAELRLRMLADAGVALTRLTSGAVGFPFLAITLVLLSVSPWFPLTVHQPLGDAVAVAACLGGLAAASSPVVIMGMITELDAGGPVARMLLALSVVKDVAVALLLTVVLAASRLTTSPGAVNMRATGAALLTLLASLAGGALLGYGLSRYLRLAARATALLLVAAAFVVAALAGLAHLEAVLVALATGFCLENSAPIEGERVRRELKRWAWPIYVLLFVLAGAGLRLGVLADLWPWVLLLVGLRVVSLRYGLLWAGRDPRVPPLVVRAGWLGLVAQGGIALGLAHMARRAFPEWGVSLDALAGAMIGVHELVGPICFRRALARVGELTEDVADAQGGGHSSSVAVVVARGGL